MQNKYKVLKHIFWITLILFIVKPVAGQESVTGNWLMYFGMNRINEAISIHTEVQHRNHIVLPIDMEQLLLRKVAEIRELRRELEELKAPPARKEEDQ